MAGKGSKSQTPVSDQSQPAILVPSARAQRMMRLGTYQLHTGGLHSTDEIVQASHKAYEVMKEEIKASQPPVAGPEMPEVKARYAQTEPVKSKSAAKREVAQKEAKPKKVVQPKAKPEQKPAKKVAQKVETPAETVPVKPEGEILPEAAADTASEK